MTQGDKLVAADLLGLCHPHFYLVFWGPVCLGVTNSFIFGGSVLVSGPIKVRLFLPCFPVPLFILNGGGTRPETWL